MMKKGLFYGEKGNIYNVSYDNLYAKDSIIDIFDGNLIVKRASNKQKWNIWRAKRNI